MKKLLKRIILEELKKILKEDEISNMYVVQIVLGQNEIKYARIPLRRATNSLKNKEDSDVLHVEKKKLVDGREAQHFYVKDKKSARILQNLIRTELRYAGIKGFETVTKQQFGNMVGFMRAALPSKYA